MTCGYGTGRGLGSGANREEERAGCSPATGASPSRSSGSFSFACQPPGCSCMRRRAHTSPALTAVVYHARSRNESTVPGRIGPLTCTFASVGTPLERQRAALELPGATSGACSLGYPHVDGWCRRVGQVLARESFSAGRAGPTSRENAARALLGRPAIVGRYPQECIEHPQPSIEALKRPSSDPSTSQHGRPGRTLRPGHSCYFMDWTGP